MLSGVKRALLAVSAATMIFGASSAMADDSDKTYIIACDAAYAPFSWEQDGKYVGIDVEVLDAIAKASGFKYELKPMNFEGVIPGLISGQLDGAIAGINMNDERRQNMDFTDTYYTSAQVIIVKENDTTFDGCKSDEDVIAILKEQSKSYTIGTQNGTTGFMWSKGDEGFGYEGFANLTTSGYSNGALAVQDLSNGRINAVVIDKQPALMISASINERI